MVAFTLSLPADFVLHIGAGRGEAAEGYVRAGLDPVILVEADPDALPYLRALEHRFAPVQVVQAAVSPQGGTATFIRCNYAELSSLRVPTDALYDLFPGLRIEAQMPVETRAVADFLSSDGLDKAGRGLLVIEAPGQALALLEALQAESLLQRFQIIRVQEGNQILYDSTSSLEVVEQRLADLGYVSWLEAASQDPDRPYVVAWLNVQAMERTRKLELAAADLAELQQRYRILLQERDAQEELLRQLAALAEDDRA